MLGCGFAVTAACGGGGGEGAKSPNGASTTGTDTSGAGAGGASGGDLADAGPTTTTTTSLGNNGDLQGAKLQSSSSTTVETTAPGGPKPKSGSDEPGRRVTDIDTIVKSRRDDARKCYDDALKAHPGIEGDLDIKWTIDPKGQVTDIAVDDAKSQIHETSVSSCIIDIIKKIKFAESAKGFETHTHYPFNFHPHGGSAKPKQQ